MRQKIIVLVIGLLLIGGAIGAWRLTDKAQPKTATPTPFKNTQPKTEQKSNPVAQAPPAPQHSLDDPSSIWVVVNKRRPLPSTYIPNSLVIAGNGQQMRSDATTALKELLGAASANGMGMKVISGYRSYANQASVYNGYVKRDGQALADTYSARPGHSEHQTGLVADLGNGTCDLEICFGNTLAGKWLAAHAHEHGFIIRYLNGKTNITGYQYEPWHIRYVGKDLASTLHASGKTMEEHFNLPAAPGY